MRLQLLAIFSAFTLISACSTDDGAGGSANSVGASSIEPNKIGIDQNAQLDNDDLQAQDPHSKQYFITNVGDMVFFQLDKSDITMAATEVLNRQASWLQANPGVSIVIEGHCDERGTREYNMALGERRANAVKEYLISQGIIPSRIDTVSYGKERPVVVGSNEQAWAQNRRGVTSIVSGAS